MRGCSVVFSVVALLFGSAACAGGAGSGVHCLAGDPFCGAPLRASYTLLPLAAFVPPSAPIPVGSSIDVAFHELKCLGNGSQSGPPPGSGCGAWYIPAVVHATVAPMFNSSTPCPVTVAQSGPGTVRVTRTGPGDPTVGPIASGARGFCLVYVSTPEVDTTFSAAYYLYV
jgi:hypothetical protein